MLEYLIEVQVNLLYVLTTIHNYIQLNRELENLEKGLDSKEKAIEEALLIEQERSGNSTMDIQRDKIV